MQSCSDVPTDTHKYAMYASLAVQQSYTKLCKWNTEDIATIGHFSESFFFFLTAFLPTFQRFFFSNLYLCNCPEKMGKIGFVLSVWRLFVFGQGKNLQGILLCQLKYGEGTTHTGKHWLDPVLYRECKWEEDMLNITIQRMWLCHSCHSSNLQNTTVTSYCHILALK